MWLERVLVSTCLHQIAHVQQLALAVHLHLHSACVISLRRLNLQQNAQVVTEKFILVLAGSKGAGGDGCNGAGQA